MTKKSRIYLLQYMILSWNLFFQEKESMTHFKKKLVLEWNLIKIYNSSPPSTTLGNFGLNIKHKCVMIPRVPNASKRLSTNQEVNCSLISYLSVPMVQCCICIVKFIAWYVWYGKLWLVWLQNKPWGGYYLWNLYILMKLHEPSPIMGKTKE